MARKKANKEYSFSMKNLRNSVKSINKFILDTTEEILDDTIERTGEWQEVGQKAMKGGVKLAAKQQDLFFDALETAKKQMIKGKKRAIAIASN